MIDPSLRRVSMTQLRRQFGGILDEVEQGQTVVVTRSGREVAVLVPAEVYCRIAGAGDVDREVTVGRSKTRIAP